MVIEGEIEGALGELAEFVAGEAEVAVGDQVLVQQRGVEHGRIVGVERDWDAGVVEAAHGVLVQRGDDAGAEVGRDGDL